MRRAPRHRDQAPPAEALRTASGPLPQVEPDVVSVDTGSLVRVIGLDSGTTLARVARAHSQSRRTAVGGAASGADVVLENGEALFVPYANLDLIG